MKIKLFILITLIANCLFAQRKSASYDPHQLVIKLNTKSGKQITGKNELQINSIAGHNQVKSFQQLKKPAASKTQNKPSILDGIYKIEISDNADLKGLISYFSQFDNVVYAEPVYHDYPLVVPNDPDANQSSGSQYHLGNINAYNAWDVTTGDTSITIAILDTGLDFDHEDLGNVQYNTSDPINGEDDDGNGFVDDYMGWDFADEDNDPTSDLSQHGNHVTGVSSATTNNEIGIAGVGYNCRFVPIKIFKTEDNSSNNAYDAIIYAADQGYDVLNLSWGSINTFSQYRQDIIDYAVLEKDVVIVAAAGNTPEELNFFPASYENVLSVAASNESDEKASFSTFGYHVDLIAPGDDVYSSNAGSYKTSDGTSFSSPMVAGTAALLKSIHPNWSARQVMEQIRVTTDNIYDIGSNSDYDSLLGTGRLDVFQALTETNTQSVRLSVVDYSNSLGQYAFFGDTISFQIDLINHLSPIENLEVQISSLSSYGTILESKFQFGDVDSLSTTDFNTLQVVLSESLPPNERIVFKADLTGTDYSDYQFFEITSEPDFFNVENEVASLTVASDGNLGFTNDSPPVGVGYELDTENLINNIGLIIGSSIDSVVSNVSDTLGKSSFTSDFSSIETIRLFDHEAADQHLYGKFNDASSDTQSLGLTIEQNHYASNSGENGANFIIRYRITNTSTEGYDSLYFSLFSDWDLSDSSLNSTGWDAARNLAFLTNNDSSLFVGSAVLSDHDSVLHNAIDISSLADSSFTDSIKFETISNFSDQVSSSNVAQTNAVVITDFDVGESTDVIFTLSTAASFAQLQNNIDAAISQVEEIMLNPRVVDYIDVCLGEEVVIDPESGTNFNFYNDPEATSLISTDSLLTAGPFDSDTIIYVVNLDGEFPSDVFALYINPVSPEASFTASVDTLFLGDDENNRVSFTDTSGDAVSWSWDMGNGNFTTLQNPVTSYHEAGEYEVTLSVESSFGCSEEATNTIIVLDRPVTPDIDDQIVCEGTPAVLVAANTDTIAVYEDAVTSDPIFIGTSFTSSDISSDTVFFVSNATEEIESLRVPVYITVDQIEADFSYHADTTVLTASGIVFVNRSINESSIEWSIDDQLIGSSDTQYFELDDQLALDVLLTATSDLGCENSKEESITFSESAEPIASNIVICENEPVTIVPSNGNTFFFYADEDLTEIIDKGSSLHIAGLSNDTAFYITGADNFIESTPISVAVATIDFTVTIEANPPELVLNGPGQVSFSSPSEGIENYQWFLEDDLIETTPAPIIFFEDTGTYQVTLIAENSNGCISEAMINYLVREEEVITDSNKELSGTLFSPNPTTGEVRFKEGVEVISLTTLDGKIIPVSTDNNKLITRTLKSGFYMIYMEYQNKFFTEKLIIQDN